MSENGKAPLLKEILDSDLTKVAIFLGAGVDPDGLASQAIMAEIIKTHGGTPHCFYRGSFGHPQNKTMRSELGLNPLTDKKFDPEAEWTTTISVDGPTSVCPIIPDFIIDHHEQDEEPNKNSDVRNYGSASCLLWEYAMEDGLDFSTEEGTKLATALAIGIITDTQTGAVDNSHPLDYEALGFALKHKDNNLYKKILNYPKPLYYKELDVVAWQAKDREGTVLVAPLGLIPQKQRGVLPYLAEEYVSFEEFNTTVIVALMAAEQSVTKDIKPGNYYIDVVARSVNSAIKMDEFIQSVCRAGGGKRGAGSAKIKCPLLENNMPKEIYEQTFKSFYNTIAHKAFMIANDGVRS